MTRRIFGVDFSGAKDAGRRIWIAELSRRPKGFQLIDCRPGEQLPGSGRDRPAALAALRAFVADHRDGIFGCDFPFSLPREVAGKGSWDDFIAGFDHGDEDAFRAHCCHLSPGREPKRPTDHESKTPWCAFNIRLYRQTYWGMTGLLRPLVADGSAVVLPMQKPASDKAWLIETCPASVLKHLGWRGSYKEAGLGSQRRAILALLGERASLARPAPVLERKIIEDPGGDALDAVTAALATGAALGDVGVGADEAAYADGRVYFRI